MKDIITKNVPLRTCIACRAKRSKSEMARVVKNSSGVISVDERGKAEGRGTYVCKSPECFAKLKKSRALNRAFKCEVSGTVYDALEEALFGRKEQ